MKHKAILLALALMVIGLVGPTVQSKSLSGSVSMTAAGKPVRKGKPTRQQLAANPNYKEAIKFFNDKNYAASLALFYKLDSTGYCCDLVHYYIGQCYQYTNQTIAASQHYNWVLEKSNDERLKSYADYANQTMAYYDAHRTYSGQGNNFSRYNGGRSAGGRGGGGGGQMIGFG
jgi:hypothetical protein